MQSATGSFPGLVNTTTQTFAGQKTFSTGLTGTLTGGASLNVLTSALGTVTEATSSVLTLTGWTNATVGSPTILVKLATTSQSGYLSSTDWNTFNGKQASGNYLTYSPNQYGVVLSGAAYTTSVLAPDASTSKVLVSGGASANPSWALIINANLSGAAAISNANLAAMPAGTVKGNITGGSATPTDVSAVAAGTASTVMFRDSHANVVVNSIANKFATLVSAAGTTTLTVSSPQVQQMTGILAQDFILPDATTLVLNQSFTFLNRSTGDMVVKNSGGTIVQTLTQSSQADVRVTDISTSAGVWDSSYWGNGAGGGTVTNVSVVTANGFAGSSSGSATPALTLTTTVTGILSGNGTAISAASTTGSGSVVLATSPTLVTPALGTPTALVGTNITGTAAGLTAGTVTTNANLTGVITSSGNVTSIASQTGTGTKFVVDTSPTLVTPALGTPTALVGTNISGTAANLTAGLATSLVGGSGGTIPYQSGAGVTAMLANGTAGQLLQSNGTTLAPTWVPAPTTSPLTTKGDIFVYSTTNARLPVGSNGQVLSAQSGQATGLLWVSPTATPTASSIPLWDANVNLSANSHINGYRTTATAAGTTTLVVGDAAQQYFTGVTTQTVVLPLTSTLVLGQQFIITNNSTGIVTVQSSGGNTIQGMAANTQLIVTVVLTSGTGIASWTTSYLPLSGLSTFNIANATDWVAYTPTFTGFGTASAISFFSRRVGDTLEVLGTWTSGIATATKAKVTMGYNGTNNNVTSDSTKIAALTLVGSTGYGSPSAGSFTILCESGGVNFLTFGASNGSLAGLTEQNGDAIFFNGLALSLFARVPISGWTANTSVTLGQAPATNQSANTVYAGPSSGSAVAPAFRAMAGADLPVPVSAFYRGTPTGTLNGSQNNVTYGTAVFDTNGAMSGATYTIPVAGTYAISAGLYISYASIVANAVTRCCIVVNGITIAIGEQRTSGASETLGTANCAIACYQLALNDTVVIQSTTDANTPVFAAGTQNYFSIARIGS